MNIRHGLYSCAGNMHEYTVLDELKTKLNKTSLTLRVKQ